MTTEGPSPEELASYNWGGQRARPRKGIEAKFLKNETYLKPPVSCGTKYPGKSISVNVECCEGCEIYILDVCEQVQVADCVDCRIVVGPCGGSVFLLDCKNCRVSVAAKQLRVRDCFDCEFRVFAPKSEGSVIETSKRLTFGCWDVAYPGLAAQFAAARLDAFGRNHWDKVYDFSPPEAPAPPNWAEMPLAPMVAHRWAELEPKPEGWCGGAVVETRGEAPSVRGCENPCNAADGTPYAAEWYDPTPPPPAPAAAAPAPARRAAGGKDGGDDGGGFFGWLAAWWSSVAVKLGWKEDPSTKYASAVPGTGGGGGGQTTTMCAVQ